ncbi:MAG: hypothetical protein AVDCRST_MAG86-1504 [uncultured Truepera sp.]|uniref:Uncharacterized protein n=1 Tax=uncultured Truepera sp. TaxID=543023 RepID=A0A6J4UJ43_9DEIN|nr:MAG: hypothetical protein AVDCRST_MAG86-1504 [uncultured Truepera sp.]
MARPLSVVFNVVYRHLSAATGKVTARSVKRRLARRGDYGAPLE